MIAKMRKLNLAPLFVGIITVGVAVVSTILGILTLPVWALATAVALVTIWSVAITYALTEGRQGTDEQAIIGQLKSKIRGYFVGNLSLLLLIIGIVVYMALPGTPPFVNVIPNTDVTLSPEAGAPPRTSYNATVLVGGEEQSAYCYVVVRGKTWLDFRDGWAPLSEFHYPAGISARLPPPCE